MTTPDNAWLAADEPGRQRQINYRNERGRAFGQRRQADGDRKPADVDLVGFIFTYDRGRKHPGRGQKQHQHRIWTTMIDHCHIGRIHQPGGPGDKRSFICDDRGLGNLSE